MPAVSKGNIGNMWEEASARGVLADLREDLNSNPQHPYKKAAIGMTACNPVLEDWGAGTLRGLDGW